MFFRGMRGYSLLDSVLFRGVGDVEYVRICRCGFLAPPNPIGANFPEVFSLAGQWQYVVDHVLSRRIGPQKAVESFSLHREVALRFATHEGTHDGWVLSFPFSSVCSLADGKNQVGKPWLFSTDSSIWVIPGNKPPPSDVSVLFKSDGEYRIEEHSSFESLPALEERKRLEQQRARDSFANFVDVNSNSVRDDEVLLLFGDIPAKLFSWERVLKTDYCCKSF